MPRAGLPLDSYCARLEKSGGSPARSEIRRTHQRVKSNTGRPNSPPQDRQGGREEAIAAAPSAPAKNVEKAGGVKADLKSERWGACLVRAWTSKQATMNKETG